MARLSKRIVDSLIPKDKAFIAWDDDIKGFGVRVAPSGSKTFVLEYRPGEGGRGVAKQRLILGRYGVMTPEQASNEAKNALARIRLGADPQADKISQREALTLSKLVDLFLSDHVNVNCKPKTAESHKTALELLRAAHGSMKAQALGRSHVASIHRSMRDRPYAANRLLAVISSLFEWAKSESHLPEDHNNPAAKVHKYPEQSRERFLTVEELSRLGDVLRLSETVGIEWTVDESKPKANRAAKPENRLRTLDPYAVAAIRLLLLTGARLREVLHLEWKSIDFDRSIVFLPDSKTGKKPVYLSAGALALLAELPRIEGNAYVFPGSKAGAPRADLKKPWAAITKAADLEGLRIHDLRHSFASIGAGSSLGLPIIGKLLGHSQPSTTQRYAHLDADPLRRAVETIGATISAAMDGGKASNVVEIQKGKSTKASQNKGQG